MSEHHKTAFWLIFIGFCITATILIEPYGAFDDIDFYDSLIITFAYLLCGFFIYRFSKTVKLDEADLSMPPWSGQAVKLWVRILAWCWTFLLVAFAPILFWQQLKSGFELASILKMILTVALELYMTVLFAHVALRGRAPWGWLPWDISR